MGSISCHITPLVSGVDTYIHTHTHTHTMHKAFMDRRNFNKKSDKLVSVTVLKINENLGIPRVL